MGMPASLHGENRILVQHGRAHIRQLAQLAVGDELDRLRFADDARVGHQEARHVGPVLVQVGHHGARDDGAGDVRAAARKGFDRAVRQRAVKAGDDRVPRLREPLAHHAVGAVAVEHAVCVEEHDLGGVDERIAEIEGQQDAVEVLAAAGRVIPRAAAAQVLLNGGERLVQRHGQSQPAADLLVPLADGGQPRGKVLPLRRQPMAVQQHIGDLLVLGKALARRARHNVPPTLLGKNDGGAFPKLLRRGKRTAAEFDHFFYRFAHKNTQSP